MTATAWPFIEIDDQGIAYIKGSTTKVIEVAEELSIGHLSPAEIRTAFPSLTMSQIHAALGYYFDYQAECDKLMRDRQLRAEELLQTLTNLPLQEQLQRMKAGT